MPEKQIRSKLLLMRQLKELKKGSHDGFDVEGIVDGNIYKWRLVIFGPADTIYEGGIFAAELDFPVDYPMRPPKMRFITEILHPNVGKNGNVCISILHAPGDDRFGYEKASERWLPIHTVESIVVSVQSMLSDPNFESPENVDAARLYRTDPAKYRREVNRCVEKSQQSS